MDRQEHRIATADTHTIPVFQWHHDSARAVIHLMHGMSEHALCYEDVAETLHQAGYAIIAHDHRCHGHSCPPEQLGQASPQDSFRAICDDVLRVNRSIHAWYTDKPVYLLGHSMGSFIAQIFAQEHSGQIDGLLLEGTNYAPSWYLALAGLIARFECWRQGPNEHSSLLHALSFGQFNRAFRPVRTEFDWLSRDIGFVDGYIADPLCGNPVSNLYWQQMLQSMVLMSKHSSFARIRQNLPVYLFAGSRDPVGGFGKNVRKLGHLLERLGLHHVTTRIYPDARHDILHETNRQEVRNDLLDWLQGLPGRI